MWFIVEFVKEILSFLKIIGGVMSAAILFLKRKGLWVMDLDFVKNVSDIKVSLSINFELNVLEFPKSYWLL